MKLIRTVVAVPTRALWCWDEYFRLTPDQRALARDIEREAAARRSA